MSEKEEAMVDKRPPSQTSLEGSRLKRPPKHLPSPPKQPTEGSDSLSKIWLTSSTLKELDQRNNVQYPVSIEPERLLARQAVENSNIIPASDYLLGASESEYKQIEDFSHQEGLDNSDLRGFSASVLKMNPPSLPSIPPTTTSRRSKWEPYEPDFGQQLLRNNIFIDGGSPPVNLVAIKDELSKDISSPSDAIFDRFRTIMGIAQYEVGVMDALIAHLFGVLDAKDERFERDCAIKLVAIFEPSKLLKPDYIFASNPNLLHRRIIDPLRPYIGANEFLLLMNLLFEVKGPDGSPAEAEKQACYGGAFAARGIQKLREYVNPEPRSLYDNKAYTLVCTFSHVTLTIYTVHPQLSDDKSLHYYLTPVVVHSFIQRDQASFNACFRSVQNARRLTKKWREELIKAANEAPENRGSLGEGGETSE